MLKKSRQRSYPVTSVCLQPARIAPRWDAYGYDIRFARCIQHYAAAFGNETETSQFLFYTRSEVHSILAAYKGGETAEVLENISSLIGDITRHILRPRSEAQLRRVYRKIGELQAPGLQLVNKTINKTDHGNPFSDGACVGYMSGFIINSVRYKIADIPAAAGNAAMFSVIEELLLANGIYKGNFLELCKSTQHRDPARFELGFNMGLSDFLAFRLRKEIPCGLISLNLQHLNKGQKKTSSDFDSFMAENIPKLFGERKPE